MSTTSLIGAQKKLQRPGIADSRTIAAGRRNPSNKKNKMIMIDLYYHITDTVISLLVISVFLGLYKVSGLHAWWVQFVGKISSMP